MLKKTRFAPSPSGNLHIGGARTALASYLWAKNMGGNFVLRIEDSDNKRSTNKSAEAIINALKRLGISWDEGPGVGEDKNYYQSNKLEHYKDVAMGLIKSGHAYPCFCSESRVSDLKKIIRKSGHHAKYDRRCRNHPCNVAMEMMKSVPYCIRLKFDYEDSVIKFKDYVIGEVEFPLDNFEDIVIIRSNGYPTYNFACVVDDIEMQITHVVRGNEHLSNTPKQIIIYQAMNSAIPKFAHLPLILDKSTGKKMSKRDNGVSVEEFLDKGISANQINRYLGTLGMNIKVNGQDFLSEAARKFNIGLFKRSPCYHDPQRLLNMRR